MRRSDREGPSAQACGECHAEPFPTSAGLAHSAVVRAKKGTTSPLNVRSVTSVFGNGILQLLAQEMTEDLWTARDEAIAAAKATPGTTVARPARRRKGTSFGSIAVTATAAGEVTVDTSKVVGVDPDLVVRPLGWKGDVPTLRNFSVGAAAGAMGLVADELVWKKAGAGKHPDVDGDGVGRELSVGDITAMTVYMAAQETPTEAAALATLGLRAGARRRRCRSRSRRDERSLQALGCATCHTPEMPLLNTRFEEPTLRGRGQYYDAALARLDPGYDPKRPFAFDILQEAQPPRAEARAGGGATIRLYGDLKRHAMGRLLADPAGTSDSIGADLGTVETRRQGGDDSGRPLPDGRVVGRRQHGPVAARQPRGDAARGRRAARRGCPAGGWMRRAAAKRRKSRDAFAKASAADQESLVAFLLSLRTFSPEKPLRTRRLRRRATGLARKRAAPRAARRHGRGR